MGIICLEQFILSTWYVLLILTIFVPHSSKAERLLPMTSVFFNPGEYWIEGGERGNNLKYEEFVKCVDDLAQATENYATVMNKDAYLKFLYLQTSGKLSDMNFQNLLPELTMAYWNLVCVIVGESCTTESTVTLKEIELYALDDGGWLIYQLCSRVDVYIQDALLTFSPSVVPSKGPTSPSPSISPTFLPTVVPSSAPSTKEASFNFAFQLNRFLPCYKETIPNMMEDEIKDILKCDKRGDCAGDLQLDTFRADTFEYSCQPLETCILVTIAIDFFSDKAINVNALRRAITTGLENYINDEGEFKVSCMPSSAPTFAPSVSKAPSRKPSMAPTITSKPSFSPTHVPTFIPTHDPTPLSSFLPTLTLSPSHSLEPSASPTVSMQPSSIPSIIPTSFPSTKQASYQFVYNVEHIVPTECVEKKLSILTLSEMEEILDVYYYSVGVDVFVAPRTCISTPNIETASCALVITRVDIESVKGIDVGELKLLVKRGIERLTNESDMFDNVMNDFQACLIID